MRSIALRAFLGALAFLLITLSQAATVPLRAADTGWFSLDSIRPEAYWPKAVIDKVIRRSKMTRADMVKANRNRFKLRVLTLDDGARHPAVVFLHVCSGVLDSQFESWRGWYMGHGFALAEVDSFILRDINGSADVCQTGKSYFKTIAIGDLYATLYHLVENSAKYGIDPTRIFAAGYSYGGQVVNWTLDRGVLRMLARNGRSAARFAGAMAYYGQCPGKRPSVYSPLVDVIGDGDMVSAVKGCRRWQQAPPVPGSAALDVHILHDVYHMFDWPDADMSYVTSAHIDQYDHAARVKSEGMFLDLVQRSDVRAREQRLAADALRHALTGNTLRLRHPGRSRTAFQYFSPDGRAPMASPGGRSFHDLRWRVNDYGELCRTNPKSRREDCIRVALKGKEIVIYNGNKGRGETAQLLEGNRLPKRQPAAQAKRQGDGGKAAGANAGGAAGYLTEAQLRTAVIGNTVAFRSPKNGRPLRVYFAPDGKADLKVVNATVPVRHQHWFFRQGAQLCRALPNGSAYCVRVRGGARSGVLAFVSRKGSYDAKVLNGRQLSPTP